MLLDIQNYAQATKKRQILANENLKLAKQELINSINNVPTAEFDKLINPELKRQIKNYYMSKSTPVSTANELEITIYNNALEKNVFQSQ